MNIGIRLIVALILLGAIQRQSICAQNAESPYELDGWRDGIWAGLGLVGTGYGVYLINQKEGISEIRLQEILADRPNINGLDRWAAGNDDEKANSLSDIPFYASFAAPIALFFNDKANDHSWQILALYGEALATTAAMYSITSALVNRSRPYVYSENFELGTRLGNNGQRSFYSGHVGATATATFFTVKVLTDFNPDAKGKGIMWATAAALPVAVGYFRIQAGRHFLTDVVLGYGLGAATGYLVPALHKKKNSKLSVLPSKEMNLRGDEYSNLAFRLTF